MIALSVEWIIVLLIMDCINSMKDITLELISVEIQYLEVLFFIKTKI